MAIHTLPDDVLHHIFNLALSGADPILQPLHISHCCKRWRNVALNTPPLWNYISIRRPRPQYLDRLKVWVERARQSQLDIYICQSNDELDPGGDAFREHLGECLYILAQRTAQWRTLSVEIDLTGVVAALLQSQHHLPEVKKFVLNSDDQHRYSKWNIPWSIAPKLQDLDFTLARGCNWWTSPVFQTGLRKITIGRWGITGVSLVQFQALLHACPLLEELDITAGLCPMRNEDVAQDLHHLQSSQVISMPNLKSLDIGWLDKSNLPYFAYIKAPNLTQFSSAICFNAILGLLALHPFPFASLTAISLYSDMYFEQVEDHTDAVNFLSQLTGLQQLTLHGITFSEYRKSLLSALVTICPNLCSLKLDCCEGGLMKLELQSLVEARKDEATGVRRIRTLEVIGYGKYFARCLPWFSANVDRFIFEDIDPEVDDSESS